MHLVISNCSDRCQIPHYCGDERSVAKYPLLRAVQSQSVAGRGETINTKSSYLASPDCSHLLTSHLILLHHDRVTVSSCV